MVHGCNALKTLQQLAVREIAQITERYSEQHFDEDIRVLEKHNNGYRRDRRLNGAQECFGVCRSYCIRSLFI
jgi:hypothetical protein